MAPTRARAASTKDSGTTMATGTDVETVTSNAYSADALRQATSFDDFARLAMERFETVDVASDVLGDGFALLKGDDAKRTLVGRPTLLLEWSFYSGQFGERFVAVRVVTQNIDGSVSKYILNDGSTGICETLWQYTHTTGRVGGLVARHGLRVSDYTYCGTCQSVVNPDVDSAHRPLHTKASTFYLDTSV